MECMTFHSQVWFWRNNRPNYIVKAWLWFTASQIPQRNKAQMSWQMVIHGKTRNKSNGQLNDKRPLTSRQNLKQRIYGELPFELSEEILYWWKKHHSRRVFNRHPVIHQIRQWIVPPLLRTEPLYNLITIFQMALLIIRTPITTSCTLHFFPSNLRVNYLHDNCHE